MAPDWSLPMRVIRVNQKRTTATLECVISKHTQEAHLERVRFLRKPLSAALLEDWVNVVKRDMKPFQRPEVIKPLTTDDLFPNTMLGEPEA